MAQIKISALTNLPNVALDDVVAIVDTSVGQTKKSTQEALLDSTEITKDISEVIFGHIAGGKGHSINPSSGSVYYPVILGGSGHTIADGLTATENKHNFIIGGWDNSISNGEKRGSGIVGGNNNILTSNNVYNAIILGGFNHSIGSQTTAIAGGESNTTGSGYLHFIGGGNGNNIGGGEAQAIIASNGSSIGGGVSSFILGSRSSSIGNGIKSGIIGGEGNQFNGDYRGSYILGGYSNRFNSGNGQHELILGGESNQITGAGEPRLLTSINSFSTSITTTSGGYRYNLMANSSESSINDSFYTSVISSSGISVSNKSNVVVLGMGSFTPAWDNFTYVDNSYNDRTEVFKVINVGEVAGDVDVDCSLGTIFTFTMGGDVSPNFINWKEGQRIHFVVNNPAAYAVPTASVDGAQKVYAKNGTLNPSNNAYTKYNGVFIGGFLYLNEETGFSLV